MSDKFEELDYQQTPLGALILRRRREPMARGEEVFEVKLDDAFLMSSLFTAGEIALADLALGRLETKGIDVVVAGLGLGFTADAVLKHDAVNSLIVIEVLEAVIAWHRVGLVPLGHALTSDARCRLIHGDFFAMAHPASDGFDPLEAERQFDAVLVDIDHSPSHVLNDRNKAFYTRAGLRGLERRLRPGGVFAMWSNDPPDADFEGVLSDVFATSGAEVISFPNLYSGDSSSCTIYVAAKGGEIDAEY
ncbi:MAG: spermidine synthase [Gammaproteobacteria bacterium]|nr:spermidine synthase [Gammaproteobacteria bacterium]